ncbi:hypothetical protein [Caldiplasma sukawensis]
MPFDVIFVEGFYDELFVSNIISKMDINPVPKIIRYAGKEKSKINAYIKVINLNFGNFIFLSDCDPDTNPDPLSKVKKLQRIYPNLKEEQISLVFPEIEGWYIAGLDDYSRKEIGMRKLPKPNECTKEKFRACLPKKSDMIEIMTQILEKFDMTKAMTNSDSFRTFIKKLEKFWKS